MKHLFAVVVLMLVAGLARADGVPLFTAAPHNKALAQKYAKTQWAGEMVTVKVNKFAIDSNVITVPIEGKEYRFIGSKKVVSMPAMEDNNKATMHYVDTWTGKAGPERTLNLSREGNSIGGQIQIDGRIYSLQPDGILVKSNTSVPMNAAGVRK